MTLLKLISAVFLAVLISPLMALGQTISTGNIVGSPFCPGAAISVPFTVSGGSFSAGNIFTAQLSDAAGSFTTPVSIGTLASTADGTVPATLPFAQVAGNSYRIRVVASAPATTSTDNGSDLAVAAISAPFTTHTKIWIGATGNWDNPANWQPCGVPNGASNITIAANADITIPSGITANTLRIQMAAGARLTVDANAVLNSNGSQSNGIQLVDANTQITNNGTINCGNFAPVATGGIALFNGGALVNNAGATITINDVTSGVSGEGYAFVLSGNCSFTNAGTLQIGNNKAVSRTGLSVLSNSQFSNAATGVVEINRVTVLDGFLGDATAVVTNAGAIKIGNIAAIGQEGINILGGAQFTNQAGGMLEINNINIDGISVAGSGTNFTNNGTIQIGNIGPLKRSGISLFTTAVFTNNAAATIEINNITSTATNEGRGIALSSSSVFINHGQVKVGNTAPIYRSCLFAGSGHFYNEANALLQLNRTTLLDGISGNGTGTVNNAGTIVVGNLAPLGQCGINLNNGFQFINQQSGVVEVNNIPVYPAINGNGAATLFNNSGIVKIGQETTLSDGMVIGGGAKFTNLPNALVEIDNANGTTSGCLSVFGAGSRFDNSGTLNIGQHISFSRRGLDLTSGGVFINQASGLVNILSTTANNADFRAAVLAGTNTQLSNAGKFSVRLTTAPFVVQHGLYVGTGSIYTGSSGSSLEILSVQ